MKQKLGFLLALALIAFVGACNTSTTADAGTGLTKAQVDAEIATIIQPYVDRIAALETAKTQDEAVIAKLQPLAKLYLTVGNGSSTALSKQSFTGTSGSGLTTKATTACPGPETNNGYQGDPRADAHMRIHSCSGYIVVRSEALSGQDSHIQLLPSNVSVYFSTAGCQVSSVPTDPPTGYVTVLAPEAVINGTVFTLNPTASMSTADYSNPAYYWYIPAGSTKTSFTALSYSDGGVCTDMSGVQMSGYAMLPNDETVTGEASAPKLGPVVGSQP